MIILVILLQIVEKKNIPRKYFAIKQNPMFYALPSRDQQRELSIYHCRDFGCQSKT